MTGAAIALMAYAGYLATAFGLRTDRSRWVRFASRADAIGGAVLLLSVSCSLLSPVLTLLGALDPWVVAPAVILVGLALIAAGCAIALTAQRQLGPAWRPGIDPSDSPPLVTDGLYRNSRNPFYVGWVLVAAGVAVVSPTALTIAGAAGLVASLEIVVRFVEEPALRARPDRDYDDYARQTRRFL